MADLTDDELIAAARDALPATLKALPARVVREGVPSLEPLPGVGNINADVPHRLRSELESMLKLPLPVPAPGDSADVRFREETSLGTRTTVVQIRMGKIHRVLTQS